MIQTILNFIHCFIGDHLWSEWKCESGEENGVFLFWYERKCVYCPKKETKHFGE